MVSLPVLLLGIKTVRIAKILLESSPAFSQPAEWDKLEEKSNDDDPSLYTLYMGCQQRQDDGNGSAVFTIGWCIYSFGPLFSVIYLHVV